MRFMRQPIALSVFLLLGLNLIGQTDSIAFNPDGIKDGLYLSYGDFRRNKAIAKEDLASNQDKTQLEFITRVLSQENFSYSLSGVTKTTASKDVYGYFQNKTFYINFNGGFHRVPVFGSISYFVAEVRMSGSFYDTRFGYPMNSPSVTELRQFLINFYDGYVNPFSMREAEALLSRDENLYAEYRKLSRRKAKDQIYRFIRKYNELHPVYFLK